MGNKSRRIGLIILLLVIAAVGVYLLLTSGPETVRLRGYVGGEKMCIRDRAYTQPAPPSTCTCAHMRAMPFSMESVRTHTPHTGMHTLGPVSSSTSR